MKSIITSAAAALLAASLATGAFAEEFTKGTVKKIDLKAKKVTLIHEELKNLDMPAMTMVFQVADDTVLEKLKKGQSLEFVAERVNGKLMLTKIK